MSIANRNRKLKAILRKAFHKRSISVKGSRGTAYGWVRVLIGYVPESIEQRRRIEAKVWRLINANDIEIGTYGYDDPGSDYGYGRTIHIDFADPDFNVRNEGTIFMLTANTEAARQWADDHLPADAQRLGKYNVAVEHRYIRDIVEGIKSDGLSVR